MFDFEKLEVYHKTKKLNKEAFQLAESLRNQIDLHFIDQWKRASLSILLNIAEGTGRQSANDKKHFYTMARGSLYECVALLDLLNEFQSIEAEKYQALYEEYEEVSKMLLSLYRSAG
jgi:four helix bundle protein